jgi:DNA polymerase
MGEDMPRGQGTISLGDNSVKMGRDVASIKLNKSSFHFSKIPAECDICVERGLCDRQRIVWGQGNLTSPIMFVGMCPGKDGSDVTGLIFTSSTTTGPFDQLIAFLGLTRNDIYLTNLVKCKPKRKLDSVHSEQVVNCYDYLLQEIKLVRPRYIVAFGKLTATKLCNGFPKFYRMNIPNITNSVIDDRDSGIKVIPVHHPSYISYRQSISTTEMWLNKIGGIVHVERPEKVHSREDCQKLDRF